MLLWRTSRFTRRSPSPSPPGICLRNIPFSSLIFSLGFIQNSHQFTEHCTDAWDPAYSLCLPAKECLQTSISHDGMFSGQPDFIRICYWKGIAQKGNVFASLLLSLQCPIVSGQWVFHDNWESKFLLKVAKAIVSDNFPVLSARKLNLVTKPTRSTYASSLHIQNKFLLCICYCRKTLHVFCCMLSERRQATH